MAHGPRRIGLMRIGLMRMAKTHSFCVMLNAMMPNAHVLT
jgi:hypothetical protein